MEIRAAVPAISDLILVLRAAEFAAHKHAGQRRKGASAEPFINHPIEVARLIAVEGGVADPVVLAAALLHDTVEDTDTCPQEIEAEFGPDVRSLVAEMTDDESLPKAERKRLQEVHAAQLSPGARLIKLADKISNVRDITHDPPAGWPLQRRREYLEWTRRVIAGVRGANAALERCYDAVFAEGERVLEREGRMAAR